VNDTRPISPRESLILVYSHKKPAWIPVGSDIMLFTPRIDPDNIARCFVFEANLLKPEEMTGGPDRHGIEWVYVPAAFGSMVRPGNPILNNANDWESVIRFPDVDSWDWDASSETNREYVKTDRFITISILTGFFERLISFMDFENAAIALIDEDQKTAVHGLFQELANLYKKMIDKYVSTYKPDLLSLHDDWGAQRAPFFSLETVMRMIVPYIRQVVDHCHEAGVFFSQHSCGKNELLVPAYIAAGVDSWGGQLINDMESLYDSYGDRIILSMPSGLRITHNGVGVLSGPEEAALCAKAFVAKYAPLYSQKPVLCNVFNAPEEFWETLYAESRKYFDGNGSTA
jgi:hypothetical protein